MVQHRLAAFGIGLLLHAVPASAQVCAGRASLGPDLSWNVGLGVDFPEGATAYGGSVTLGSIAFGTADFEYTDIDDTDLALKRVSLTVGYETVPGGTSFGICPTIGIGYGYGLELNGVSQTTLFVTPALAAGLEATLTPTLTLLPFAQVGLVFRRDRYDRDAIDAISGSDGRLLLGTGFLFGRRFAVSPTVAVPIAAEGDDLVLGVIASVAFRGAG